MKISSIADLIWWKMSVYFKIIVERNWNLEHKEHRQYLIVFGTLKLKM